MGQPRRRPTSRDDLINRYANCSALTYGEAKDLCDKYYPDIEGLRGAVEVMEEQRSPDYQAARRSFAESQPTTTVKGQTR